jgi:protein phosphatase 1 regulatory subunit 11
MFVQRQPLVLKLKKPQTDKKVQWEEGVVDNEFMGRKSSKCCCIYTKPSKFGESDTESDSADEGCCHEHRMARRRVPRNKNVSPSEPSTSQQ